MLKKRFSLWHKWKVTFAFSSYLEVQIQRIKEMGCGEKIRFILAITPFRRTWPMNLQHLECSHRNCLQEGDLNGLTKVTFGAASRLPLFWWFSAHSDSCHPPQAAMRLSNHCWKYLYYLWWEALQSSPLDSVGYLLRLQLLSFRRRQDKG